MPGVSVTVGHLHVVRWDTITKADFEAVVETVRKLKTSTGKDVVYVAIQDDHYAAPDAETTELMKTRFDEFAGYIKADYLLITAKGIKATLQRSFLRAAIAGGTLMGVKGAAKVVVLSSLDELFEREAGNLPTSRAGVLAALEQAGALPRS